MLYISMFCRYVWAIYTYMPTSHIALYVYWVYQHLLTYLQLTATESVPTLSIPPSGVFTAIHKLRVYTHLQSLVVLTSVPALRATYRAVTGQLHINVSATLPTYWTNTWCIVRICNWYSSYQIMPKSGFAPKCYKLTSNETQGSFENWRDTLLFNLSLEGDLEFLLQDNLKWGPISAPDRGFIFDTDGEKKTKRLCLLSQCFCPSIFAPAFSPLLFPPNIFLTPHF